MEATGSWSRSSKSWLALGLSGAFLLATVVSAPAQTAANQADQIKALQEQINKLQQAVSDLKAAQSAAPPAAAPAAAAPQTASAGTAGHGFLEKKPGDALTFFTPGGEITAYGYLDVSLDAATKGISGRSVPPNSPDTTGARPIGRLGYLFDESTNLSNFGVRGFQRLGDKPFNFVYQLETQIDIASNSGTAETNSNQSNVVKGGLTSRNSFIGLASGTWGAIKLGKTDAPYKTATARLNPFSGTLGDYQVIMGNTGGDNRVEFGTRLEHSIWYESPKIAGFSFNALYSPGQNRASDSDNIAAGSSDCAGGNIPGSGGGLPVACNDGSFSDAISANLAYENGPFYITAAYERHQKVNRASDISGSFADTTTPGSVGERLFSRDVADEDAVKIAVQYTLPTKTTVGGIFEDLHRYVPDDLSFQNERQRTGYWLTISQQITDDDSVHFGWGHANKTPGDPGQHNTSFNTPPGGTPGTDFTAGAGSDNSANMFTLLYRHQIAPGLTWYADGAMTVNAPFAHYDLGAGGRAVTVDCHDANGASGGTTSTPHCFAGGRLIGVSTGLGYRF
jgi:predicted porin